MSGYIIDWLREGRLDVGLVFGGKSISGVQLEPLIEEELYLAADTPGDAGAARSTRTARCRCTGWPSLPMILPTGHHGLRRCSTKPPQRHGVTRGSRIEIDSLSRSSGSSSAASA